MTVHMRPYVKDGIELDQIAVEGIRVAGFHGVNPNEREGGQLFYADVVAHLSTRAAGDGDDLSKTVNYSDLADRAAEILAGSPFQLIEAVAAHIARGVLEFDGVQCVDVTVHKPQAPLHVEFKDVTVTIRRDLKDGGLWADKRIGSSAGFSDDPGAPGGAHAARDVMDERPAQPARAVIALGGNLGEVEPTLREALNEIHRINGVTILSVSPLVRSVPEGGAAQPDYLNAVARIETSLAPRELLAALNGIEMVHGRDRTVPGSARTLDLDIVSYEGVVGETADLTLPHPRAHQRGFVVLPWVAMERDAVLEPHGAVADLARSAQFDGVTLVSAEWPRVPAPDALAHTGEQAQVPTVGLGEADAPVESSAPAEPEQVPPETVVPSFETEPSVPSLAPDDVEPRTASAAAPSEPTPIVDQAPQQATPASDPLGSSPYAAPVEQRPVSPYGAPSAGSADGSGAFPSASLQGGSVPSVSASSVPAASSSPEISTPGAVPAASEPAGASAPPPSVPSEASEPSAAEPWTGPSDVEPSSDAEPSATPRWAPVGDADQEQRPGVPTRTSFGVARQTPPAGPEGAGSAQ
ncbi:2-amino-4-hydroxy-6-hydroxymethyldihydropteridine diphosphokinase [Demequina sp. NBRC 110053]|uniref:2-amino-4-hydroxy-6- hydroxymethyldihydropteridine diphosphokinase n=1 Tax=Demequina sp. NBRC 110053 TaxID=1570342 RepID=UPI0009FE42D6|nr:2-amino-4-hydroxy-6-hydroxymethyldihydropteridine diphosphokinase [Demequina sp. NBRC 110053]